MNNKVELISNLFEGHEIRCLWDLNKEDYWISVVDVIEVLTGTNYQKSRNYWKVLKSRLSKEGSQLVTICNQLKMKSSDGKYYLQDTLNTDGIFRLIESIPSKKAEPFKIWLANLGKERVDEVFDPSLGIDKMIDFYLNKGYSLEWIKERIDAIINRKKLTQTWKRHGISDSSEYAILTRELTNTHHPIGLEQNKLISEVGGGIAKNTKKDLEEKLGKTVINNNNKMIDNYK